VLRVYSRSAASRNQTSLALSALGPFVCVRIWRSASANQSIVAPSDLPWRPQSAGVDPIHHCCLHGDLLDVIGRRPRPCDMLSAKQETDMQLQSTLTCPKCSHQAVETMPTNACQFFYDCKGCGERLKPLAGDCCVFCSYGSVPCPPIQSNLRCCVPKVH
jgi:hypothetical protein